MEIPYGFKKLENTVEANKIREFKSLDIVNRLGVITPKRVHLKNYPIDTPISIFNASIAIKNENVVVYARIILGYYMYVSAIVRIELPIEDLMNGVVNIGHYPGELVVYPTMKYDIWGVEDPRTSRIDGHLYMVYSGRTINYFNPVFRRERTLPVIAVNVGHDRWVKTHVVVHPQHRRVHVISDKDAFITKIDNTAYLFHRPHMDDEKFYLVISKMPKEVLTPTVKEPVKEVVCGETIVILDPADFETRLGWAGPLIEVKKNEYLVLVHGIDRFIEGYRVFAVLLGYSKDTGFELRAVTPFYIMEPKQTYEVFGDRPYVVFPCGAWRLDKDTLLISYGAADYLVGFGTLNISEVLGVLDKGRLD